jgi:hypothetical protein
MRRRGKGCLGHKIRVFFMSIEYFGISHLDYT